MTFERVLCTLDGLTRPHRLGLPMVVCVECLPADKPWGVVSATRRSSGVAPRACVRVYVCAGAAESVHIQVNPRAFTEVKALVIETLGEGDAPAE